MKSQNKTKFGVFSQSCCNIPTAEERKPFLLKTFEDYANALSYAESIGEHTAIHWTDMELEDNY